MQPVSATTAFAGLLLCFHLKRQIIAASLPHRHSHSHRQGVVVTMAIPQPYKQLLPHVPHQSLTKTQTITTSPHRHHPSHPHHHHRYPHILQPLATTQSLITPPHRHHPGHRQGVIITITVLQMNRIMKNNPPQQTKMISKMVKSRLHLAMRPTTQTVDWITKTMSRMHLAQKVRIIPRQMPKSLTHQHLST